LGARVDGVEIDPLAIENAEENAILNRLEERIVFRRTLDGLAEPYDLVLANILKPVLLEFAEALVRRLKPGGGLILSGLIDRDVAEVNAAYSRLLGVHCLMEH